MKQVAMVLIGLLSISANASDIIKKEKSGVEILQEERRNLDCDLVAEISWATTFSAQFGTSIEEVTRKNRKETYLGEMALLIDEAIYTAYSQKVEENEKEKYLKMYSNKINSYQSCKMIQIK